MGLVGLGALVGLRVEDTGRLVATVVTAGFRVDAATVGFGLATGFTTGLIGTTGSTGASTSSGTSRVRGSMG